ncbi:hypothetical protein TTHERM_00760670 (macronuclear) [Tetrahymena thermophila SB210]|uniref:Uncharacterized protein n=1 Tax=Tetrahymena thermophila (strain SB210) TaxID=312017 RepID=I7MCI7_TETTS|nr:hypothetical protein TTHERM_00760670 [Tetrahymena thermophila SB210]EAR84020.1 hypothetical protein TTHERM_00760670 [Tetrahymena thermophila SB210]|eukprot:XP_001031683.1 hypothetical protein TTHERM_00760670 [Tetrahymena thermophila SB210]
MFMNCQLSKCYYKQYQYFKAKQKFEIAQHVLSNQVKQKQLKILEIASQHFKSNSIPKQYPLDEIEQDKPCINQLNEKNLHSSESYHKFIQNVQLTQQKTGNQTKYFNLDLSGSLNNQSANNHELLNYKSELYDQNSLEASQKMLLSKKIQNQESQLSFFQQTKIKRHQLINPQNEQTQLFNSSNKFDLQNNTQQNNNNNNDKSETNMRILYQNFNSYLQYSLSEYFIYKKKYRKAAEILTELFENSQTITSNIPFRIVFNLKQIFDAFKIEDTILQTQNDIFDKINTLNSNSSLLKSHESQLCKQDKQNNCETQSFNYQQQSNNVFQHFNQMIQEEEDHLNKNLNQQNKSIQNFINNQTTCNQINLNLKGQMNYSNFQPIRQTQDQKQNCVQNSEKSSVDDQLNDYYFQFIKNQSKIQQKTSITKLEQSNFFFFDFIAKALDQLISYKYIYTIAENNYNQIHNPSKSNFQVYKQYMSEQLGGLEQEKPLKFIIYQTDQINFIKDSLFLNMCNVLVELNIQIIIFQAQLHDTFSQSYNHKNKEVIKIFKSYNEIVQYLIFKRNSFSKFTQFSYVQYY